jgi:hypothetical protein
MSKFSIFNDITNKKNYAIFKNQKGHYLKYNIFLNYWVSVRDYEFDNESKMLHTINMFKILIPTTLLSLSLFLSLFLFKMNELILIIAIILSIFIIVLLITYCAMNDITYFSNINDLKYKLTDYLNKMQIYDKKVMIFNENGEEITGIQLERINKFKNVI